MSPIILYDDRNLCFSYSVALATRLRFRCAINISVSQLVTTFPYKPWKCGELMLHISLSAGG